MTAQRTFHFCAVSSKTAGAGRHKHQEIHVTDLGMHASNEEAAREARKIHLRPDAIVCTRDVAYMIADSVSAVWKIPRR